MERQKIMFPLIPVVYREPHPKRVEAATSSDPGEPAELDAEGLESFGAEDGAPVEDLGEAGDPEDFIDVEGGGEPEEPEEGEAEAEPTAGELEAVVKAEIARRDEAVAFLRGAGLLEDHDADDGTE